jgi:anaerobic magnesium-protoporphyrin IX monomethyl ester cyclase
VTGLPGEKTSHRAETMKMLFDVGFDWVKIFIAIPIAGSRLYEICIENGYLVNDSYSNCITTKCVIKAPEIDAEQLEDDVYRMNLDINFVNNYNIRTANYSKAIIYFENIVHKYPDHAFAHYALAIAYKGVGYKDKDVELHQGKFVELINKEARWGKYAKQFGLA